jgi:hypothetical protein
MNNPPEATVIIRHWVADYHRWKRVFDADLDTRLRHGGVGHRVLRSQDDPNELTVVLDFASRGGALGFLQYDPALISAMEDARVIGGAHHKQWSEQLLAEVDAITRYPL